MTKTAIPFRDERDRKDHALTVPPEFADRYKEEMKIVQSCDVDVTGVTLMPGDELQYAIKFQPEKPSFQARTKLQAHNFDVGQHVGQKDLHFFAVRRRVEGKGWEV